MGKKLRYIFLVLTPAEKRQFWIQIVLNLFISIADIAALALLLLIVNFYINHSPSNALRFLPAWMLDRNSVALIAFFFIFFSIKNLLGIIISNSQFKYIGKTGVRISKQKLESYLNGGYDEFVNVDSAAHIRKIAFQPFEFSQHILGGIQQLFIQAFLILITVAAILMFNPRLFFLLFVILLPPIALVFFFVKRRVSSAKKNIHTANENSFRYLLDALKGYVESNIHQRKDFFIERFATARKEFSHHLFSSLAVQAMPGRIIESFAVMGLFVLIVIIKWSATGGASMLVTVGAFMAAAYKIIPGIVKMINAAAQMKTYEFSIYDLETNPRQVEAEKAGVTWQPLQSLQLKDVSFHYRDQQVLQQFSFCINAGDFIGITGKSGRGKTTILNLILGFLTPVLGEVCINEKPVSNDPIKNYWPSISYVRQQPFLIHDTILKNICLQENNYDKNKLEQVIEISGLKDLVDESPEGLNKLITENGKNISGGQQQRIALARALYKEAELFLLDEPFNELDEASTVSLVKYFKELSATGKMVIMVTHDTKCLSYCNKVISLDEQ